MKKEKPKKNTQKLTDRDLRELMGQNMQLLKRAKAGPCGENKGGIIMNQTILDIPQIDEEN
ncbi:hypothetical protein [Bacillus altitudinis]|uniref:hypothetical protein n=1 Tax=Bacillus altitudinis TaxID=293387 RepID=UPI000DBC17FA|nr:hypothetical protein PAE4_20260 [Bacillus altitudinis]